MLDIFNSADFIVFTTRDFAGYSGVSMSAASKRLLHLSEQKLLQRITKGVWANTSHPWFHPLACVPYLLGKEQGYVSFLTALHLHGLVSQIPKTIQVATTGHARTLNSPISQYEFLQIKPELMLQGTVWSDAHLPYLVATAEKALIDTLYLSTRKNRRFARLPEVALEQSNFRMREFERLMDQLPIPPRISSAIRVRAETLFHMQKHFFIYRQQRNKIRLVKSSSHQARPGERIYSNGAAVYQGYFASLVRGPYLSCKRKYPVRCS